MWIQKEIQSRHFTEKLPAACRSVWNLQKRSCERGSWTGKNRSCEKSFSNCQERRNAELKRAVSGAECRCPDTTDLSGKSVRCRVSLLKGRAVTIQRERCHIRMWQDITVKWGISLFWRGYKYRDYGREYRHRVSTLFLSGCGACDSDTDFLWCVKKRSSIWQKSWRNPGTYSGCNGFYST